MAVFAITTTTTVTSGDAFTLTGVNDRLFVGPGASLITRDPFASGVVGLADAQRLDLAGYVVGVNGAVMSGVFTTVTVAASGGALGDSIGLLFGGLGAQLINAGIVSGASGVTMQDSGRVDNRGEISGSLYGVRIDGAATIINHGSINALDNAVQTGGATLLTNYGTISGNVLAGPPAIFLSGLADTFVNAGLVVGSVAMNGGNDLLDLRDGKIEGTVFLGSGDDTLLGGNFADRVEAGSGADEAELGGGNDTFVAIPGDGEDTIDGGAGLDAYDGSRLTPALQVNLLRGDARIAGETDLLSGIERVYGGRGSDAFTGDNLSNLFRGNDGNDSLRGNDGDDTIHGGNQHDTLWGDSGNDWLFGGEGRDRILGGSGEDLLVGSFDIDTMTGESGADRFDFNDFEEFIAISVAGNDRITDFEVGLDKIDLSTIDADTTLAGNQAFVFVGTGAIDDFGELRYRHGGGNTFIQIGYNTASGFDVIRLDGIHNLTAADFYL